MSSDASGPEAMVLHAVRGRGEAPITGEELQGVTGLAPSDVNAAVSSLAARGWVETRRYGDTAPFDFASVRTTEEGRAAPLPWVGRLPGEELEALRALLRTLPDPPGPDDVPRFAQELRASRIGPAELESLLEEVPADAADARSARLRSLLETTLAERTRAERRATSPHGRGRAARPRFGAVRIGVWVLAIAALAWGLDAALGLQVGERVAGLLGARPDVAAPPPSAP